jgi:hypothetical protein
MSHRALARPSTGTGVIVREELTLSGEEAPLVRYPHDTHRARVGACTGCGHRLGERLGSPRTGRRLNYGNWRLERVAAEREMIARVLKNPFQKGCS